MRRPKTPSTNRREETVIERPAHRSVIHNAYYLLSASRLNFGEVVGSLAAGTLLCVCFGPDLLGYPARGTFSHRSPPPNHRHPSILHSWVTGPPAPAPISPFTRVSLEHFSKNHRRTGWSRSFHNKGLQLSCRATIGRSPRSLRRVSFLFAHPLIVLRVLETGDTPSLPPSASAAPKWNPRFIHPSSSVYLALPAGAPVKCSSNISTLLGPPSLNDL